MEIINEDHSLRPGKDHLNIYDVYYEVFYPSFYIFSFPHCMNGFVPPPPTPPCPHTPHPGPRPMPSPLQQRYIITMERVGDEGHMAPRVLFALLQL
jgi:hypothetical protein